VQQRPGKDEKELEIEMLCAKYQLNVRVAHRSDVNITRDKNLTIK
jgi:hypothetical protein